MTYENLILISFPFHINRFPIPISRWMNKEVVVHIHKGILLNYKNEHIWVSSNEVEPGAYYTEWSKSERERQIPHISAYTWNLERWYQWSYMQGSKGDTDLKNRLLDSVGKGKGRMTWENSIEYVHYYM